MSLEDTEKRPIVPYLYSYNEKTLVVSPQIIVKTYSLFAEYCLNSVESVCFWYGERRNNKEIVKAVIAVDQQNFPTYFGVSTDSMLHLSDLLDDVNWVNLAQLHSHPWINVEHSKYDDIHVNSRKALSIVLPKYGKNQDNFIYSAGIHEYQNDYWYLLSDADKKRRVTVSGSEKGAIIDVRTYQLK